MMVFRVSILCIAANVLLFTSCKNNFYTTDDFRHVKKIDTHVHLNSKNAAIAELASAQNFHLLTVNVDVPSYPSLKDQETFALHQIGLFEKEIDFLTAFTLSGWEEPGWSEKTISLLDSSFALGALGIKLWKNIGMVYKHSSGNFIMIDDPKFDEVINHVIKMNKTVMAHLGEPKNCWLPLDKMTVENDREYFKNHPEYHMFLHPEYPSYEEQIDARDRFLEKHPDMRFVGAHLGSLEYDVDELAKRLDKFPNMAVDLAARIPHLQFQSKGDHEKVKAFLIKYQDRIIYATDSGISSATDPSQVKNNVLKKWLNDWKYFATDERMNVSEVEGEFRGLKLPKDVIDKIYHLNAVRWFKIDSI